MSGGATAIEVDFRVAYRKRAAQRGHPMVAQTLLRCHTRPPDSLVIAERCEAGAISDKARSAGPRRSVWRANALITCELAAGRRHRQARNRSALWNHHPVDIGQRDLRLGCACAVLLLRNAVHQPRHSAGTTAGPQEGTASPARRAVPICAACSARLQHRAKHASSSPRGHVRRRTCS